VRETLSVREWPLSPIISIISIISIQKIIIDINNRTFLLYKGFPSAPMGTRPAMTDSIQGTVSNMMVDPASAPTPTATCHVSGVMGFGMGCTDEVDMNTCSISVSACA
jgi:hypothetical protein